MVSGWCLFGLFHIYLFHNHPCFFIIFPLWHINHYHKFVVVKIRARHVSKVIIVLSYSLIKAEQLFFFFVKVWCSLALNTQTHCRAKSFKLYIYTNLGKEAWLAHLSGCLSADLHEIKGCKALAKPSQICAPAQIKSKPHSLATLHRLQSPLLMLSVKQYQVWYLNSYTSEDKNSNTWGQYHTLFLC